MVRSVLYEWRKAPFFKLVPALVTGILMQWYLRPGPGCWYTTGIASFISIALFRFIPLFNRYRLIRGAGLAVFLLLMSLGAILSFNRDIRNNPSWLGHHYQSGDVLLARLLEPLSEKNRSFKTTASLVALIRGGHSFPVTGKILLYFRKPDTLSTAPLLGYGSLVLLQSPLLPVQNTGNPGSFDYKNYCLRKQITHQSFPGPDEYRVLNQTRKAWIADGAFRARDWVLSILRHYIPGETEQGLAEALLTGYRDDLDKDLVQSYSNTGVVHIIAISGLHIGLIYWLLGWMTRPLKGLTRLKWCRPLLIITGLWGFSLLAGAQPSVLRSALMFSFMVLGRYSGRKSTVYNSLAASAFVLLCINPFWLWDPGFQLSYAAVLSIVLFMRPIYQLLFFPNKIADLAWKLNAVTIAAQVLTIPLCVYHFKQFPVYFLLSNFVAVPLSSLILLAEILLIVLSGIPVLAEGTGRLITTAIRIMNRFVRNIESIPGAVWDNLQIQIPQVLLLYLLTAGCCSWLAHRHRNSLIIAFISMAGFSCIRSFSFLQSGRQEKILVYQVPGHSAMDFIYGRQYFFYGDSLLEQEGSLRNFHLRPARIRYRVSAARAGGFVLLNGNRACFNGFKILVTDTRYALPPPGRDSIDLLLVSSAWKTRLAVILDSFPVKRVVFDSSVPRYRTAAWKKDCTARGIPYHDVAEKGAFVMNLN